MERKIIVLIPHYNNPFGLENSINSIDEEIPIDLLIIDDGSGSKFDKERIAFNYNLGEVLFEYLPSNQGLSETLNKGIAVARELKYEFIGRLDCGDLCMQGRFKKQIEFLDKNKDYALIGSWAKVVDEKGASLFVLKHPTDYNEIKKKMYLNSMFVHPSVVIRLSVLKSVGLYNSKYSRAAQDYDLFFRIIKKYKATNLPEVLIVYETSPKSISTKRRKHQVSNRIKIIMENFYLGIYPIHGLIRSTILYFLSRKTSNKIKSIIKN